MTDIELFHYHKREMEKAVNRITEKNKTLSKKAEDKWVTTVTEASEYMGVSRTTFYKKYHSQLDWTENGVKKSWLDNLVD